MSFVYYSIFLPLPPLSPRIFASLSLSLPISFFSFPLSLLLKPRPKKAINRYPSEVIPPFALTHTDVRATNEYTRTYAHGECFLHTRVPRTTRSRVCEAFWALSRNAEWVMHPVQAWGRQMNYNISFSRPYIPTDRAYWRGLIAFNSLLVQSCNVNAGRGRHVLAVTRSRFFFSFFFFHRSPTVHPVTLLPFRAVSLLPPPSIRTDIASLSRLLLLCFSLCDDAIV